jgi:hypothetical protein
MKIWVGPVIAISKLEPLAVGLTLCFLFFRTGVVSLLYPIIQYTVYEVFGQDVYANGYLS